MPARLIKRSNLIIMLLASATICYGTKTATAAPDEFTLSAIHQKITKDYKSVVHIDQQLLQKMLTNKATRKDFVLFDVREPAEFAVSHLEGAVRISPSTWRNTFLKNHGKELKGKTIIFYCSVGVRSSKMAEYLREDLASIGARQVYNLKEGIFGWANHGAPMVNQKGITNKVHPYDNHWGQLVTSKELRQLKP